jgi:ParB-like chromosome segregation protein Spo0J
MSQLDLFKNSLNEYDIDDNNICQEIEAFLNDLSGYPIDIKIHVINKIKLLLHSYGPFNTEPVDCVIWVKSEQLTANDYNPNKVAPPEMKLLEHSIVQDGYTQPIVTWDNPEKQKSEVIDGFHRNRVGKESKLVRNRIHGYLPIVGIRKEQSDKNDRIASTIRHNRARGKHQVNAMSEIVIELKNRNWTNERISKQLGMDEEEVLRLCQISGLENIFTDKDFSKAWESSDYVDNFEPIEDDVPEEIMSNYRIPNEGDVERIFHTYEKWECHKAGFYATSFQGKSKTECNEMYREFLADLPRFEAALAAVTTQWKYSCEHYLTNVAMNRIAWLGQASMCFATGVPSEFRGGFSLLTKEQQQQANETALKDLNKWLVANRRAEVTMDEAMSGERQSDIY